MNISLLSKMVKEIILDHDRVSLPGLGSFVAQMVPSSFSDKGYTIHPPYRRLSFRNTISEDDYLVQLYAQANEVDIQLAGKIIRDFVEEIKDELNSSKLVVFPGLGRLRATKENIYFFIVDEDTDIWPAGSGMQPVSLKSHNDNARDSVQFASVFATVDVPEEVTSEKNPDVPVAFSESEDILPDEAVSPAIPESVEPAPEDGVANVEEFTEPVEEQQIVEKNQDTKQPYYARFDNSDVRNGKTVFVVILVVIAVLALMLAIFILLAHFCPDFIDNLLYSPAELDILHYSETNL